MKVRPTEAEFDELKRKRDEALSAVVAGIAKEWGVDPAEMQVSRCARAHDMRVMP